MQRRQFLSGVVGTTAAAGFATATNGEGHRPAEQTATISQLYFDSTCSLLNADGEPLASDDSVVVRAAETAEVTDEDGNGDATPYDGVSAAPALAAVADGVAGLGAPFVTDSADFAYGNDEFLLNLWDELIGGGTVLWDEGHEQYYYADRFGTFLDHAEDQGYTVESTTDMTADLGGADALVVTSPSRAFDDAELSAIQSFRDDGGAVILHSQSDYQNFDETDNMNALAAALSLPFRFDDCQVVDDETNAGSFFQPATTNFVGPAALFESREGVPTGPEFQFDTEYTAEITDVADGDTFTVSFPDAEGGPEEVRVLGVDTPEVPAAADAEDPHEWEGLGDEAEGEEVDGEYPYLSSWGEKASSFAKSELANETVTLTFDENEGIEDPFGRLLAYAHYDRDGSGSRDTLWSREVLSAGYARVYDSGLSRHDELLQTELAARADDRGVWGESDPDDTRPLRDEPVSRLVFPQAVSVGRFGGDLADERVPVRAAETASQPGAPLVAVDPDSRLAAVGGTLVGDDYVEEFDGFGNEPFVANLLTALSDLEGDVLWDGGHGQFSADAGTALEGASAFQRYLEGVDLGVEQVNDYDTGLLVRGQALLVTPPARKFGSAELSAIRSFRDAGGAVVLFGSAASTDATERLNAVAAALGSDLTLGTTGVTDPETAATDEADPTTTAFGDGNLFGAHADTEPSLATATPTPTTTPTPTGTTESATPAETTTRATTETTAPGLGVVSTAVAAVGGGLAALAGRRRGDDGDGDD